MIVSTDFARVEREAGPREPRGTVFDGGGEGGEGCVCSGPTAIFDDEAWGGESVGRLTNNFGFIAWVAPCLGTTPNIVEFFAPDITFFMRSI